MGSFVLHVLQEWLVWFRGSYRGLHRVEWWRRVYRAG